MDKKSAASSASLQRGVLIETDVVVLPGMEVFFDVSRARLTREGIKLDRDLFLRFLFGRPLARGITALLEKLGKSGDAAALAAECVNAYRAALEAASGKTRDGVLTFAKDMAARGIKVGLITQLSEEAAKQVFADVLDSNVVVISETPSGACLHGWEGWRRAARKLAIGERLCLAISSPASARGALAASMRVVVVQDPMQDHVDCGGTDMLVESFTPAVRAAAMGLLKIEA